MTGHGYKAIFITIEGDDGAGKSTLAKGLYDLFEEHGKDALVTEEPGATPGIQAIMDLVGNLYRFEATTELLLTTAARHEHIEKIIRPGLKERDVVICSGYHDSVIATHVHARGLDEKTIHRLNKIMDSHIEPNLTLILNADAKTCLDRLKARDNVSEPRLFESHYLELHQKITDGLVNIYKDNGRCQLIDATQSPKFVLDKAWAFITRIFPGFKHGLL